MPQHAAICQSLHDSSCLGRPAIGALQAIRTTTTAKTAIMRAMAAATSAKRSSNASRTKRSEPVRKRLSTRSRPIPHSTRSAFPSRPPRAVSLCRARGAKAVPRCSSPQPLLHTQFQILLNLPYCMLTTVLISHAYKKQLSGNPEQLPFRHSTSSPKFIMCP